MVFMLSSANARSCYSGTERFRRTQSDSVSCPVTVSRKHFVLPLTSLVETSFFKLPKIEIMAVVRGCKNRMVILQEDINKRRCWLYGLENECEIDKKIRNDLKDKESHYFHLDGYYECRASEIIPILEKYGYEFHHAANRDLVEVIWEFMRKV